MDAFLVRPVDIEVVSVKHFIYISFEVKRKPGTEKFWAQF